MTNRRPSVEEVERLLGEVMRATRVDVPEQVQPGQERRPSARRVGRSWLVPALAAAAVTVVAVAVFAGLPRPEGSAPASGPSASSGRPTSSPGSSSSGVDPDVQAAQEALRPVQERILALAADDPAYDVTAVDLSRRVVTVYRADPTPDRLAATYAAAARPGVRIAFARALLSRAQQDQLARLVAARRSDLARHGVRITQSEEERPGGRYRIGYDPAGSAPGAAQLAPFERFGKGTVYFAPVPPAVPAGGSVG
jgi:hypothetical protein